MPTSAATIASVPGAAPPNGDYSHVVRTAGPLIHIAGFMGDLPDTGAVIEGGVEAQAEQAMKNIQACLEAAGSGVDKIVRRRLYFIDITRDLRVVQAVWKAWVPEPWPVSTAIQVRGLGNTQVGETGTDCIQVGALAKPGALIEIEVDAEG